MIPFTVLVCTSSAFSLNNSHVGFPAMPPMQPTASGMANSQMGFLHPVKRSGRALQHDPHCRYMLGCVHNSPVSGVKCEERSQRAQRQHLLVCSHPSYSLREPFFGEDGPTSGEIGCSEKKDGFVRQGLPCSSTDSQCWV